MKKVFDFVFMNSASILAEDASQAVAAFKKQYPNVKAENIRRIVRRNDSMPVASVRSDTTKKRIYYEPGCPYGYTDCILDPMKDIARQCAYQSDLTKEKRAVCEGADPKNDTCLYYDNENR